MLANRNRVSGKADLRRHLMLALLVTAAILPLQGTEPVYEKAEPPRPASFRSRARPEVVVPPQHWSYPLLARLAEKGLFAGRPVFFFRGGRSFTRYEIAVLLSGLWTDIKKKGTIPDERDLALIRRLAEEYRPEIELAEGNWDFSYTAMRRIEDAGKMERMAAKKAYFTVHGAGSLGARRELEKKVSSWDESLSLSAERKNRRFDLSMSGTNDGLDRTSPAMREFDVANEARISLDRYSYEIRDRPLGAATLSSVMGFTGGGTYDKGLTAANLNVEGLGITGRTSDENLLECTFGRTQVEPSDILGAFHYQMPFSRSVLHVQAIFCDYDPLNVKASGRDGDVVGGLGLDSTIKSVDLSAEAALMREGGSAAHLDLSRDLGRSSRLGLFVRSYRRMDFSYNSPPLYTGISGGDDVNDLGGGMELRKDLPRFLSWTLRLDESHRERQGRFFAAANELEWRKEAISWSASHETEWALGMRNEIIGFRCSRAFLERRLKASADWSGEWIEKSRSRTSRVSMNYDLIAGVLSASGSLSFRDLMSGYSRSMQLGMAWNVTATSSLSVLGSFSSPDPASNNVGASYVLRF